MWFGIGKMCFEFFFFQNISLPNNYVCSVMFDSFRCAGVCAYEGRGGLCSIRLSEPLLKLRPRKDLVQVSKKKYIFSLLKLQ